MAKKLRGHKKDLGGFHVTRILPNSEKFMVGPFIFVDHMGPATFAPGQGIDVRPHPHIGLATITYMIEGKLLHRDSLGNCLEIEPGDVNWMTAGSGIVHSERESIEVKASEHSLNGMQCWVALPKDQAEVDASFTHVNRFDLPHQMREGVLMRLIAGTAFGMTSPVKTYSPMFYLDVLAPAGRTIDLPFIGQDCALYVLEGSVTLGDTTYEMNDFVLAEDEQSFETLAYTRVLVLGGEKWREQPHIYWNFVSFDRARIDAAKQQWERREFPPVPGDDKEFTPLP